MPEQTNNLEDGRYESDDASYYVKGNKIMMQLKKDGSWFKTTSAFIQGKKVGELSLTQIQKFDASYEGLKSW